MKNCILAANYYWMPGTQFVQNNVYVCLFETAIATDVLVKKY